ncbi:MAG TPA: hypothetical protein VMT44_03540 [Methanoregula sp.]|nr:hypothetical protein [Methanoregula sp.]
MSSIPMSTNGVNCVVPEYADSGEVVPVREGRAVRQPPGNPGDLAERDEDEREPDPAFAQRGCRPGSGEDL